MRIRASLIFCFALLLSAAAFSSSALAGAPAPSAEKIGWKTTTKDGIDWLVDPKGKLFYSKGVNIVTPGKESEKSRAGHAYCWNNFYPTLQEWRAASASQLREWGFNTLGGWSDPDVGLPFMVDMELGRHSKYHWFDPFNPEMERIVLETARELDAPYRDNPNLIGYFSDNEVGWWNSPLFAWYLQAPWENHTKKFLWKMIYETYSGNWEAFLGDWSPQGNLDGFERLKEAGASVKLRPGGYGIRLVDRFMAEITRRYYELMYKSIKAVNPRALVLGDRLPLYYHQDAALAIGDNVDVVSTNYNLPVADGWVSPYFFEGLRKLTGKPILVTEFFFSANENRSGNKNCTARSIHPKPGHLMTVDTQAQRTWGSGAAVLNFAKFPFVVGAHWFQYCDEPLGGREDGEDYNMGLLDTSNRPYEELTLNFMKLNAALDAIHSAGGARREAEAGPVKIARAECLSASDQSLMDWDKTRTLLSGFSSPAPYLPFGDVHLAWAPEGFYLFSIAETYVKPDFLDYQGSYPRSEAFQFHFSVNNGGKRRTASAFFLPSPNPSFPDGFEVRPELLLTEEGAQPRRLPVEGRLQRIEKSLPHMWMEGFFPAEWFGVGELKPGMRLKVNIGLLSYYREFAMSWAGKPDAPDILNPAEFREIELE